MLGFTMPVSGRTNGCPEKPGAAQGDPGPFGREVMPLEEALAFIASEGFFWIHAS